MMNKKSDMIWQVLRKMPRGSYSTNKSGEHILKVNESRSGIISYMTLERFSCDELQVIFKRNRTEGLQLSI